MQFYELGVAQRVLLEGFGGGGQVDAQFLRRCLRFHIVRCRWHIVNGNILGMSLTIAYVHGTAPDKWFARYAANTSHGIERTFGCDDPLPSLFAGEIDVALARLPDPRIDTFDYHVVRLYEEEPGIGLPADNELTLLDAIGDEDIADGTVNYRPAETVDVAEVRAAAQVVAANVGMVIAPRPLLRSMNFKGVAHRPYTDGAPTTIAVVWHKDKDCDAIQDFVGITRGRTANSSRQSGR